MGKLVFARACSRPADQEVIYIFYCHFFDTTIKK